MYTNLKDPLKPFDFKFCIIELEDMLDECKEEIKELKEKNSNLEDQVKFLNKQHSDLEFRLQLIESYINPQ